MTDTYERTTVCDQCALPAGLCHCPDSFAMDVAAEAHRIRVREAARQLVDRENTPPAEPFDAGTLADILARPPEPPFRVENLIPADGGTLIVAQRKTGKTTWNLNLVHSLITGQDFLGTFGVRPVTGKVAILNYEVSGAALARWSHEVGIDHQRFYIVNLRGRRNPLTDPDDRARLAQELRNQDVESLIVDPFGRAYNGKSQNDPGEVGAWLVDLDLFARAEVGARDLILAAHAGWNGERTRGSSALEDWADAIITLTRDPDDESLRFMKAQGRDVDLDEDELGFDETTRRLSLTGNGSRKQRATSQKTAGVLAEIVETLKVSPGYNTSELERSLRARGVPLQKGDVAKACKVGLDNGTLQMELGPRGAKQYHLPRRTPTHPDGAPLTYPDPTHIGGVGQRGTSATDLPRAKCTVCKQPMTYDDGTGTHPTCTPTEGAA